MKRLALSIFSDFWRFPSIWRKNSFSCGIALLFQKLQKQVLEVYSFSGFELWLMLPLLNFLEFFSFRFLLSFQALLWTFWVVWFPVRFSEPLCSLSVVVKKNLWFMPFMLFVLVELNGLLLKPSTFATFHLNLLTRKICFQHKTPTSKLRFPVHSPLSLEPEIVLNPLK